MKGDSESGRRKTPEGFFQATVPAQKTTPTPNLLSCLEEQSRDWCYTNEEKEGRKQRGQCLKIG